MSKAIIAAACFAVASCAFAQSVAPDALTYQQEKVKGMLQQYLAANDAIEKQIDEAVSTLTSLSDSVKSGTKVADTKMDAIESLKAGVDKFRLQRQKVEVQLRQSMSSWDPETLKKVEAFLDGKIQKRVEQIMTLANSIDSGSGTSSETPKVLREDGWGNYREVEDTGSKESKQADKMAKREGEVQKETREAIEKRIVDIENQIRTLKSQSMAVTDPERKAEYDRQVSEYEGRLVSAKEALSKVGELSYAGGGQEVETSSEGHKLNMKLRELTMQLQSERVKCDALGTQLMNELARLDSMKARAGQ